MTALLRLLAVWFAVVAAAAWGADGLVPVPPLRARVTDLTGTLAADRKQALEQELAAFEARKGSQIAVLLLPTTAPEPIEAFGIRVAEAWKVGRKGVDDGVILIIAKDDRRLRIEVGYGLEGVLNDATAKRIVAETITPSLRQGDFAGGILAGVRAIAAVVEGEALPAPGPKPAQGGGETTGDPMPWLLGAAVMAPVLHAMLGLLGSLAAAAIGAAAGWWIFGSGFAAVVAAVIVFALSFLRGGPGFWSSGGGYRGGTGGGGFSGGGGGFGGGGASGRW